jgi:Kef-type K+ transport system membrane component KefB
VVDDPIATLLLAGGGGINPLVQDIGLCVLASALLALVFFRVRLPVTAAFIFAGVLIGPIGLGLITDKDSIETIAKLGLTLLLFIIGLEINLKQLLASGKTLFITGIFQVPLTIIFGLTAFWVLNVAGFEGLTGEYAVLYLGLATAFSSTLLVVKTLQTRLQMDTVDGRLCVGLLIFQDIWAIVVLALQPSISNPDIGPIARTFIGIAIVVTIAAIVSRWVLPWAFQLVAKMPEVVVLISLGWCFGLGIFAGNLGAIVHLVGIEADLSVSMEMGALIAGTSIATLPYAHEVVAKVGNLRDFFITLFFVALGMGIPAPDGAAVIVGAVLLAIVAIGLRYILFQPLFYFSGVDQRNSVTTATKMAQISEFALVIVYLGLGLGHITEAVGSMIIFAFVLTAIVTPALFSAAEPVHSRIGPALSRIGMPPRAQDRDGDDDAHKPRLAFLGLHRVASSLLHDLARQYPDLMKETLVVDFNVQTHDAVRALGAHAHYGDVSNPDTLLHTGVNEADIVISTVGDDLLQGTDNETIAREIRRMNPNGIIIVNAVRTTDVEAMYEAGANYVYMSRTEASYGLVPAIGAALNGELGAFIDARNTERGTLHERKELLD